LLILARCSLDAAALTNRRGQVDRAGAGLHTTIRAVVANLIHQGTRSVIKVVRYGLNIQCYPDAYAVELCEKVIARQREHPREPRRPFWTELHATLTITLDKKLLSPPLKAFLQLPRF